MFAKSNRRIETNIGLFDSVTIFKIKFKKEINTKKPYNFYFLKNVEKKFP